MHILATLLLVGAGVTACGSDKGPTSELNDLQLTGVDFELNSIIIENNGAQEVLIQDLWIYRDGAVVEVDPFTVEPRSPILFSMRDLGAISTGSGEIALVRSEAAQDPETMLAYVAWGANGFELGEIAAEAGLWPEDVSVETSETTLILQRIDLNGTGPDSWAASDEIG